MTTPQMICRHVSYFLCFLLVPNSSGGSRYRETKQGGTFHMAPLGEEKKTSVCVLC